MMKPENLTTIANGGVAERGRIIYEAQNGTTTSPLLCIAPRQMCCSTKSPLAQSVLPSRGSLFIHLPTYCLSPRMCASSRTTMARIIGYQQHSLPPFLPLSVL